MEYNAKKYYKGTKYMVYTKDLLNEISKEYKNKCEKVNSNFEYKAELNKILNDVFKITTDCIKICDKIEIGRQNINKFDSYFEESYFEEANLDSETIIFNSQQENSYLIDYTNSFIKLSEENTICLKQFDNLFDDEYSDKEVVEHFNKAFEKEILNGNKDVEKLLKALIKVKMYNPDLGIILSTDGSYYSSYYKEIAISNYILEMNNTSTLFHEMGHALHHLIDNNEINTDVKEMITNAKKYKETNSKMSELFDWFASKQTQISDSAYIEFYEEVKKETGMNQEEYFNSIVKKYESIRNNKIFDDLYDYVYGNSDNHEILNLLGIDIDTAHLLLGEYYSSEELASQYVFGEINERVEAEERGAGLSAMHDIIDAVYQGEYYEMTQISSDGTVLNVYGHGADYYNDTDYVFYELVANYTDLKTSGNEQAISDLKEVFGESFLNEVDKIYNSFIEYGDYTQI